MAVKWYDGAEVWGDANYQLHAYAQGSTGFGAARILPGVRSLAFGGGQFLTTPSLGEQNTWIPGFGLFMVDVDNVSWSWRFQDAGVEQCRLELVDNGSSFELALKRGANVIDTTSEQFSWSVWHHFELSVTVRAGVNGAYELRHNENTVLSGSGVNLADSGADGCDAHSFGHNTTATKLLMDDINIKDDQGTVNNSFVGDVVCAELLPTSDGASTQFTPSTGGTNFNLVDDPSNGSSTADYVSSDTNGQKDLYGYEDLPATGIGDILAVKVTTSVGMAAVGSRTLKPKYRASGGSEGDGDDFAVSATIVLEHPIVFDQNPVTAAPWQKSDIDDGEFGIEVVS